LCQIIEPVWWERVPAGNGLDSVSQRLTSFTEVFTFFDPENINIIGGPRCIGEKHHVSASYQEHANRLVDALFL
jgi:hypothetical protein